MGSEMCIRDRLCNVYLEAVGRREYTFPVPWSSYISQRPGRSRYSVSSKIDIRTSFSLRYLLGGRRCWGSMPKAVEPGARGSFSRWTRWCGWLASLPRLPNFAGYSALLPIYFCAAPPGRYLVSCTVASITVGVSCLVASIRALVALTLAPFLERSTSLMVHFVGVHFTPNDASGSSPLGAASLGSFAAA